MDDFTPTMYLRWHDVKTDPEAPWRNRIDLEQRWDSPTQPSEWRVLETVVDAAPT